MPIFGQGLSPIENRLSRNIKTTKTVFPEETKAIEEGLALMYSLTEDVNEAVRKDPRPQMYANRNLFARNRELLLNGYFCMLCSNYGTQFVILRTILENNDLMRLFNLNPQYAYEWLSAEKQERFPTGMRSKYRESGKHNREFKDSFVRGQLFQQTEKEVVRENLRKIYGDFCDYTHPNFQGWHELMGLRKEEEIILEMPAFTPDNAFILVRLTLYLMQLSFKTLVETFKRYILDFLYQLEKWQRTNKDLMMKYLEKD
jgi:hypothetical protein